jgi:acyl-CoA hydrolase
MEHYKLILPEFLNNQGTLFGGHLLKWIDEFAYITASLEYPGNRFVTVALDKVVFKHRIAGGQVLRFRVEKSHLGNTSVEYLVRVFGTKVQGDEEKVLFETRITFVNVSESGEKEPITKPAP